MFRKLVLCVFLTTLVQANDYQQTLTQWDLSHQDVQPESQAFIENFDHDFTLSSPGAPSGHGFFGVYKSDSNEDYEQVSQERLRPPVLRLSPGKPSKPGKSGKDKSKYDKDSSSEDIKYSPFGKDYGKYSSEEQKPIGGKNKFAPEEPKSKYGKVSSEEQKPKFDGKASGKKKDLKPVSKEDKTTKYDKSEEADYSQSYFPQYPTTFARPVLPYQNPSYDSQFITPNTDKKPSIFDSFSHQLTTDYEGMRNKAILLTDQESKYSTPPKNNFYNYPYSQLPQTPQSIYEPYKPQYNYPIPNYYYNPIYSYEQYETPTNQFDSTHGTVSYRPKLQLTSAEAINTPSSNIQKISPTPVFPGLYWKSLGDQYKDAFIKTKADLIFPPPQSPGQIVNPDGTATPVYPGLIWYTYGQNIGKAFTDAKLNNPFGPLATPTPAAPAYHGTYNPTYVPVLQASKVDKEPVETTTKIPTIYSVYWSNFGSKIKEAFNKTKTTTPAPTDGTASSTPVPVANPAVFWSTFGTQIAKAFTDAKFKINAATKPTLPPTIVDPLATPAPELDDLFWQNFEKQLEDIMTPTTSTTAAPVDDSIQQVQQFDDESQQINQYLDQQLTQDQILQQFQPYKVYDDVPNQEISQQTISQQYADPLYGISHEPIGSHPQLQLSKVKDVTSKPDLYWKTFGEKIKETFNKTTTMAPTGIDGLDTTAPPPGFWTDFGKMIGKAFVDTKAKLISATLKAKSTTVAPIGDDAEAVVVQEPETEDDINEEFWSNFEQQLTHALNPPVTTKIDTQQPIDLSQDLTDDAQHVQQIVIDDDDLSQKLSHGLATGPNKLKLSAGIDGMDGQVAEPDLYWKNYGQEIADNFDSARDKIKDQVASFDPALEEDKAGFWSQFGLDIKNTFNDAKYKAMDISNKIQKKLG